MENKKILITGGTSGLGKATALNLAIQGAEVVITARDEYKANQVVREIIEKSKNDRVTYFMVDLASMESVRKLARNFKRKHDKINVLINNAGMIYKDRIVTVDGFEKTLAVNHLSHFLLTHLIMDELISGAPSRIINVSSEAQTQGHIYFDDIMLSKKYNSFKAYSQSKLANILFTYRLAENLKDRKITVNAVHPGAVRTNFGSTAKPSFKYLIKLFTPLLRPVEKGIETILYLTVSPEMGNISGQYFYDLKSIKSNPESYSMEIIEKFWKLSEELCGLNN
ncbi:SDR family oxidoreductase [Bacteroidota bacterium]